MTFGPFGLPVISLAFAGVLVGAMALRRLRRRRSRRVRAVRPDTRARRPGPPPAARVAATAVVAAPRLARRHTGRLARGLPHRHPAGRVHRVVHPVGTARQPRAHRRLAGRPHRPDAGRPDRLDVPLPRHAPGDPCRVIAVVGLAARPQARLVLRRELRRRHVGGGLRPRQPRDVVAGDPGDGVRRLAGIRSPRRSPWPSS